MKISYIKNLGILILIACFASSCVVQKSPVTGTKRAYGYSWEEEVQLGKEADQQIRQQYGVYDDEDLLNYVESVGQEILSVSHMRREDTPEQYRNTKFYFRILNSPVPNAFALPGGYVYVTRGLLAHLENEAQLAVVLGHEIAHVAARHASQRAFEQQMGQIALIGGAVAGQELLGVPGENILALGGQAAQLLFLSYSRDDERESDKLGVEYAAMQNYEASDGAGFFSALERLSEQSGQSIPTWQSTHPDPGERAERIPELAEQWREKGYEQNIEDTEEYMRHIEGMIYGNNPREGFTENGTFYHPDLKFQFDYPTDWQLVNQATLVAVVSRDQDAVTVMQIDNKSDSPRASVDEFVSQQGFAVQSHGALQSNLLNGYEAIALATAEDGTEYGFYIYAVSYGDEIYRFTSYCLADKFSNYHPYFEETSTSFASLTNQRILEIQPMRLQTMRTDRSAPFSSYLPNSLPLDAEPQGVAIANQVELDETVEAGSWIKIPRQ